MASSVTASVFRSDDAQKGIGLAFLGGLALSIDIPLIRLALSDPYMVMAWRGAGLAIVLGLYGWLIADRTAMPLQPLSDPDFLTVGTLVGVTNIAFTLAVFNTSTANVVFILAFNPLLAALLSWPLAGERPDLPTALAIAATLAGVAIIVADGLGTGNWLGDGLALFCAAALALALVLTRRSGRDLSLAPAFGGLVSAAFALPMALAVSPWPQAPVWLAIDAFLLVPVAGIALWLAPRYINAPTVGLFYLLETVLAPIWVWIIFVEVPALSVIAGGVIVVCALTAHSLYNLARRRRSVV